MILAKNKMKTLRLHTKERKMNPNRHFMKLLVQETILKKVHVKSFNHGCLILLKVNKNMLNLINNKNLKNLTNKNVISEWTNHYRLILNK